MFQNPWFPQQFPPIFCSPSERNAMIRSKFFHSTVLLLAKGSFETTLPKALLLLYTRIYVTTRIVPLRTPGIRSGRRIMFSRLIQLLSMRRPIHLLWYDWHHIRNGYRFQNSISHNFLRHITEYLHIFNVCKNKNQGKKIASCIDTQKCWIGYMKEKNNYLGKSRILLLAVKILLGYISWALFNPGKWGI